MNNATASREFVRKGAFVTGTASESGRAVGLLRGLPVRLVQLSG
jgi:hypothetical protein